MPIAAALPFIGAGISALKGLFGGGGNKQQQQSTSNTTNVTNQTQTQKGNQSRIFDENPLFMQAREGLLQQLAGQFNQANIPLYGQQQQAAFMANVNDLTNAAMNSMKQQLGSAGALNSGRFAGGVGGLQKNALNQIAQFNAQIPVLNRQYADQQKNALSQLAANWLGLGPVNETTNMDVTNTTQGTNTSQTVGNATGSNQEGQGGWKGALGGLLDFGGGLLGDVVGGKGPAWGIGGNGNSNSGANGTFPNLSIGSGSNPIIDFFKKNPTSFNNQNNYY